MSAESFIYVVGLSIASMAFIFTFMLMRNVEITEERISKILGDEVIDQIKNAKNDDEIKAILRAMPKKKKTKLKTLMESQDVRVAIKEIRKHILKEDLSSNQD
jgi:Xaa-Pro aminopeptidase